MDTILNPPVSEAVATPVSSLASPVPEVASVAAQATAEAGRLAARKAEVLDAMWEAERVVVDAVQNTADAVLRR